MVVDGVCRVDMLTVIIAFDVGKNKTLLRDRMFGHSSTQKHFNTLDTSSLHGCEQIYPFAQTDQR